MAIDDLSFRCPGCGEIHPIPFAFHASAPAIWADVPQAEIGRRAFLSSDQCVVRDSYFIRGLIRIPIVDRTELFEWGVWVSLSKENFGGATKLRKKKGRESVPPYFGWLGTDLAPHYPSTLNLKTLVRTQPVGLRPLIEVEPTDHQLAVEQMNGITFERVQEIARLILHGAGR